MKRLLLISCLIALCNVSAFAGDKKHYGKKAELQPGDELNMGVGLTHLVNVGSHLNLDFRAMAPTVGAKISFASDLDSRVIRFKSYSISLEGVIRINQDAHLLVGYRWAAIYSSAYSTNTPLTNFKGVTAGAAMDVWSPKLLKDDRVSIMGTYWFSKTRSVWPVEPMAPKVVVSLTYFFF